MRSVRLTDRAYWVQKMRPPEPFVVVDNPFARQLEPYLPVDSNLRCVEVGAFPGGNLCFLAKRFHYEATAIEYREDAHFISELFRFNGLETPEIINRDFVEVVGRKFDVVTSFGFVEHFVNYDEVIQHHVDLLADGGYLVVSVPHFAGMQRLLRKAIFRPEALDELFRTHNLEIMDAPRLLASLRRTGVEVLHCGYAMNARFWIGLGSPKVRPGAVVAARMLSWLDRNVLGRLPSCGLYSPMVLAICRKAGAAPAVRKGGPCFP